MAVSKKCKGFLCLIYVGLLFMSAILLLGATVYFSFKLVSFTSYFKFAPAECIGPFILIFLLASMHLCATWLGVNGTVKKKLKFIFWLLIVLVFLIVAEFSVGIWAMVLCGKVRNSSTDLINTVFHDFKKSGYYKSDVETKQTELQCCGANNISDYTVGPLKIGIPVSCCETEVCDSMFKQGCSELIIDNVKKLVYNIGLISFGSGLLLGLGLLCFYSFYKTMKDEEAESTTRNRPNEENPLKRGVSRK
ncbi:hypothetical protein FQR65_LT06516 [Abscondita terminalis]|nr:hypothetical protein FQR65_LT06516 [Abscondita terminalis]